MNGIIQNLFQDVVKNKKIGMWAWLLQRLTGVLLALYLFAHLTVISYSQRGAGAFDRLSLSIQTPGWYALDIALIVGIVFHGLNGIRIIAVEFGAMARAQKAWLFGMGAIGLVIVIFGVLGIVQKMMGHAS
jgi:succinate dehydrogenase / fumarate reductase cytochrome b subunit